MLVAETAYNFLIQSLSETELERVIVMFDQHRKPKPTRPGNSHIWTIPECTEILLKVLHGRTKQGHKLKNTTSNKVATAR